MRRPHRSQGFTLLEMALVVGIGGLIMAAIASGYRVYLQGQQMRDVNIRLVAINQALNAFAGSSTGNRFPCPADPSIPMTALNAGQEVCSASGAVVQITGAKDADGDGQSTILIGAVPFAVLSPYLGQSNDFSFNSIFGRTSAFLDPWGHQYMYAITTKMTLPSAKNEVYGTIAVQTEYGVGNVDPQHTLVDPPGSATYVIFSVGKNGMGGYTATGAQPVPCVNGTKDAQNCKHKNTFVSGLMSLAPGASYFDDILFFSPMLRPSQIWTSTPSPTAATAWATGQTYNYGDTVFVTTGNTAKYYQEIAAGSTVSDATTMPGSGASWQTVWTPVATPPPQTFVYNTQLGRVGIGTGTPQAQLQIDNNNLSGALSASTAQSQYFCDSSNNNCLDPNSIGGSGMVCPQGMVLTGISYNQPNCAPAAAPLNVTPCVCDVVGGVQSRVVGIGTFGQLLCGLPPTASVPTPVEDFPCGTPPGP